MEYGHSGAEFWRAAELREISGWWRIKHGGAGSVWSVEIRRDRRGWSGRNSEKFSGWRWVRGCVWETSDVAETNMEKKRLELRRKGRCG